MSGNYDFPPASNSSSRRSASDRPQETHQSRLQNLRDLILYSSERGGRERSSSETVRALETLNNEIEQLRSESARRRLAYNQSRAAVASPSIQSQTDTSDNATENTRQPGQNQEQGRFPANTNSSSNGTNQISIPAYEGGRWIRPSEAIARLRGHRTNTGTNDLFDLEQAAARLREANATISSVLNGGLSSSFSASRASQTGSGSGSASSNSLPWHHYLGMTRRPDSSSSPGSRWRSKRRKLDSDDNREGLTGFSYGHYGQVVPGPLKMEISSCDGGNYYDEGNGESSWPGNVLLDDSSVYCTKKSRCNMVLSHRGETPFSLKKVIIRAPKKGFDAPIQEGMIFVSMSSDELLERTAQYQIHYPPQNQRCHDSRRHYSNPSREYLNAYRARARARGTATTTSTGDLDAQAELRNQTGDSNETAFSRRSLLNPTYAEPQFRVTTEHDINSDDATGDEQENDEIPSATEIELLDMGEDGELFCPEDEEDSDDGDTVEFNRGRLDTRRQASDHRSHYGMGSNRLNSPSLIEPALPSAAAALGGDSNGPPDIMKPHARFFIERENSMVSIKFDPPVSGRFILIKLWSPYSGGNIDIESIMVHGFAGTRFFPALDVR